METKRTSELILAKIHAKLPSVAAQHKLQITRVDVQAMLIGRAFIWAMIVECTGAIVGEENRLVYSHGFMEPERVPSPLFPTDRMIDNGINTTCLKLAGMRRLQLATSQQNPN